MSRPVLAVVVGVAALALLVSFAWQSRSVPLEAHVARYTAETQLERSNEDFSALVSALDAAWREIRAPGQGARAIAGRLAGEPAEIGDLVAEIPGSSGQRSRIQNSLESWTTAMSNATRLAEELLEEQAAYAESVGFLRESGPQIIQAMREIRLERAATDTFQLLAGTLELASPASARRDMDLRRLLAILARDQSVDASMPTDMRRLRGAVETVLNSKPQIASKLDQLSGSSVARYADSLNQAVADGYATSVRSVDQARLMLSVYSVLLFVAVGFVVLRLQGSYRELNHANESLEGLNESLEQRVAERTNEVERTLRDLKESQVQLVQAEKMSSLGQLVAGISHEINTPLLYLANNAELLKERVELFDVYLKRCAEAFGIRPEDFEQRAEYQERFVEALRQLKVMLREDELEAAVDEALDLTRDSIEGLKDLTEMAQSLKDFSRLDRAPVSSFDVNSGLDKTLIIAKNIVKHKADVRKYYEDVPEIQCSPSQINQVFLNLITNAAQAIEDQGEIVITTKLEDEDHVSITISDTGCGISEENLGKIRDPFFTTKEVGAGTGLGLSIVDEIVRSHGGDLRVRSEVGKGSSFTVVLPIQRPDGAIPAEVDNSDDSEAFGDEGDDMTLAQAV